MSFKNYGVSPGEVFQVNANVNTGLNKGILDMSAGLAQGLANYKAEKDKLEEEASIQDLMSKFDKNNAMDILKQANGKNAKTAFALANIGLAYSELKDKKAKEDLAIKSDELKAEWYKGYGLKTLSAILRDAPKISIGGEINEDATIEEAYKRGGPLYERPTLRDAIKILGNPIYNDEKVLFDPTKLEESIIKAHTDKDGKLAGIDETGFKNLVDVIKIAYSNATSLAGQKETTGRAGMTQEGLNTRAEARESGLNTRAEETRKLALQKIQNDAVVKTTDFWLKQRGLNIKEAESNWKKKVATDKVTALTTAAAAKTAEEREAANVSLTAAAINDIEHKMRPRTVSVVDRGRTKFEEIPGLSKGAAEWEVYQLYGPAVMTTAIKNQGASGAVFSAIVAKYGGINNMGVDDIIGQGQYDKAVRELAQIYPILYSGTGIHPLLDWKNFRKWLTEAKAKDAPTE